VIRAATVGQHDLAAGTQRGPRHRLADPAGTDDSHVHRFLLESVRKRPVEVDVGYA
jgi:hypothetical protein